MTIHSPWAFTESEQDKARENMQELKAFGLVKGTDYTIKVTSGYAHFRYTLMALTTKAKLLTATQAALVAAGGNLCFGGRDFSKDGDIYTGIVHTD
jgi:hypothetical protein